MADQYTEVTTKSWGNRLGNSFGAIIGSFLLFVASFVLLYWNEGRVDMSMVAATAIEVPAERVEAANDGKLVSVTGQVTSPEMIGDGLYLAPGNYLGVTRSVEMYAWEEKTTASSEVKVGGSEETKTTYSYDKRWTQNPASTSTFKVQDGHINPPLAYEGTTVYAGQATLGAYTIYPEKMELPAFTSLNLAKEMIPSLNLVPTPAASMGTGMLMGTGATMTGSTMTASGTTMDPTLPRLLSNALYLGKGTPESPQIGDTRISYKVLAPGIRATVFGQQSGTVIDAYTSKDGKLYVMYPGNRAEAIASMHNAYVTMTWVLRLVGFLMMWGGLSGVFAPVNVLLDVLPFLGSLSRGIIGFLTFIVALILTILTIILSMLLHNLWLVLALAVVGLIGAFLLIKTKSKKAAAV